VTTASFRCV